VAGELGTFNRNLSEPVEHDSPAIIDSDVRSNRTNTSLQKTAWRLEVEAHPTTSDHHPQDSGTSIDADGVVLAVSG